MSPQGGDWGWARRQQFIDLLVERAAAGEAPSTPQPPEAGARRAGLYGVLSAAANRHHETMSSSRCAAGVARPDAWRSGRDRAQIRYVTKDGADAGRQSDPSRPSPVRDLSPT